MTGMAYTLASWRNNSPPPSPSDSIFKLIAFNFIFILHIFCCSFFNLYIIIYSLIFCYFPPTIFSHKNAITDAILYQFCLKFLLIMITTSCITLTRWSRLIWDPTAVWMLTFFFATNVLLPESLYVYINHLISLNNLRSHLLDQKRFIEGLYVVRALPLKFLTGDLCYCVKMINNNSWSNNYFYMSLSTSLF